MFNDYPNYTVLFIASICNIKRELLKNLYIIFSNIYIMQSPIFSYKKNVFIFMLYFLVHMNNEYLIYKVYLLS